MESKRLSVGAQRRMGCGPLLRFKSDCTTSARTSAAANLLCAPHPAFGHPGSKPGGRLFPASRRRGAAAASTTCVHAVASPLRERAYPERSEGHRGRSPKYSVPPLPQLAGKGGAQRRMGCGPLLRPKSDRTNVSANLRHNTPAFRTPSTPSGHLPRFAEKGRAAAAYSLDCLCACRSLCGARGIGGEARTDPSSPTTRSGKPSIRARSGVVTPTSALPPISSRTESNRAAMEEKALKARGLSHVAVACARCKRRSLRPNKWNSVAKIGIAAEGNVSVEFRAWEESESLGERQEGAESAPRTNGRNRRNSGR